MDELLEKAVQDIAQNHRKIIDDWCKAYMAQLYQEGKSIDVGSFTLVQQNLSIAQGEVGYKYWFESGKPSFDKKEWIMVKDRLPADESWHLVFCKNFCHNFFLAYYHQRRKCWLDENREGFDEPVTHWMDLPPPP